MAEDRRRDIVRKTKNGLDAARRRGRVGGGRPVVHDDERAASPGHDDVIGRGGPLRRDGLHPREWMVRPHRRAGVCGRTAALVTLLSVSSASNPR
ncbi:hypothetical protein GCM10023191_089690 [Actinoallomurus oryzae]|uniref:Resolvase/invertase-type recombinase catalytic domain-containing protein n=1 Tax=Actinoallomurus oryzae TaxID=502180 RepID=A0ABP8R3J7_9ACTN